MATMSVRLMSVLTLLFQFDAAKHMRWVSHDVKRWEKGFVTIQSHSQGYFTSTV